MNDHRTMMQLTFILVFTFIIVSSWGHERRIVDFGWINGTTMETRKGRTVSAYLGIPYAQPPVGPLRFRNPQRKWNNEDLPGDADANVCPQLNDDGELIGDEDCLYLNVYTPEEKPGAYELWPVMVYFHGGQFVRGSGTSADAGPDYLLDRNIVLVTVNYRLGVLGFLSTRDNEASGNFGLKDQALALAWVQYNILAFNGHPVMVTIFGQGAGGASTSLHAFSPSSKDLFGQYISQSGDALAYWSVTDGEAYKKHGLDLANKLNCSTTSTSSMISCLRGYDVYSLVNSNDIFDNEYHSFSTWGPTVERKNVDGPFLTDFPVHELVMGRMKDVPAMFGNVADEGLILTAEFQNNENFYQTIADDLMGFITWFVWVAWTTVDVNIVAEDVYYFYFNITGASDKKSITNAINRLITDLNFVVPSDLQMRSMRDPSHKHSNCYYYSFNYRGTYSNTYRTTGSNENIGVDHGDDLIYLFPPNPNLEGSADLQLSESDEKMIDLMVDLWTSFATTGIPMISGTAGIDPVLWEPYGDTEAGLQIGNGSDPTVSLRYNSNQDDKDFWSQQLSKQVARFLSSK